MTERSIRLQKVLADRGVASRRHAAELIKVGRVTLDDVVVREPGQRVIPSMTTIAVDGVPLPTTREACRTVLLYKPSGYVCSTTVQGRGAPTVFALLRGIRERLVPVGRLDKASEGLLLLSNDGALVQTVTHPSYEHPKVYDLTVSGHVDARVLRRLRSRMLIDGYRIRPVQVTVISSSEERKQTRLRLVLREGRNRQIRKMCEAVGLRVRKLVRIAVKDLTLEGLAPGEWRDLTAQETEALLSGSSPHSSG